MRLSLSSRLLCVGVLAALQAGCYLFDPPEQSDDPVEDMTGAARDMGAADMLAEPEEMSTSAEDMQAQPGDMPSSVDMFGDMLADMALDMPVDMAVDMVAPVEDMALDMAPDMPALDMMCGVDEAMACAAVGAGQCVELFPQDACGNTERVLCDRCQQGGYCHSGACAPFVIDASSSDIGAKFGSALAIDGDVIAVGAPLADADGVPADTAEEGVVYIYRRDDSRSYVLEATLTPSGFDADSEDQEIGFGTQIEVEGDRLIISAPREDAAGNSGNYQPSGAVYIFEYSPSRPAEPWQLIQKLAPPTDVGNSGEFGHAISLDGDRLAVGRPFVSGTLVSGDTTEYVGAVYVYERRAVGARFEWVLANTLAAVEQAGANFGASLDLRGDLLVVGARFYNDSPTTRNSGRVYVFERQLTDWSVSPIAGAAGAYTNRNLGFSVVVANPDTIYASATNSNSDPNAMDPVTRGGVVIEYSRQGASWVNTRAIYDPDTKRFNQFGWDLDFEDPLLVIGAPGDTKLDGGEMGDTKKVGRTFLYDVSTGTIERYSSSPFIEDDRFGFAVGISQGTVAVGEPRDRSSESTDTGSVHVFGSRF